MRQIRYTDQGTYLVDLLVESEFTNALTVDSQFYIGSDPNKPDGKALIVEQARPGGTLLANGALVMGAEKPSAWRQMLEILQHKTGDWEKQLDRTLEELRQGYEQKSTEIDRDLDAAIAELNRRLRELQEAMRQASSSEEIQSLRRSAEELLAELQRRLAELNLRQPAAPSAANGKQGALSRDKIVGAVTLGSPTAEQGRCLSCMGGAGPVFILSMGRIAYGVEKSRFRWGRTLCHHRPRW
ncbi:MAG: hypothetical protein R2864_11305 [Syntrophotaleaceae bacterium]